MGFRKTGKKEEVIHQRTLEKKKESRKGEVLPADDVGFFASTEPVQQAQATSDNGAGEGDQSGGTEKSD